MHTLISQNDAVPHYHTLGRALNGIVYQLLFPSFYMGTKVNNQSIHMGREPGEEGITHTEVKVKATTSHVMYIVHFNAVYIGMALNGGCGIHVHVVYLHVSW